LNDGGDGDGDIDGDGDGDGRGFMKDCREKGANIYIS
jgi:hypothetical protein